jgi:glucose/arabinose dehydrogenase
MTMWLVRKGTETFYRDIEKDGDADLDYVYGEMDPVPYAYATHDDGGKLYASDVQMILPGRRKFTARDGADKPMHNFVPTGESIDFDLHTITREQYQARD